MYGGSNNDQHLSHECVESIRGTKSSPSTVRNQICSKLFVNWNIFYNITHAYRDRWLIHSIILGVQYIIHLFCWGLGLAAAEQVEDLDQTRSKDNDHKEGDKGGADAWAVLVALGNLAGVDVSTLGDILVEFAISVADVSGKRLLLFLCMCMIGLCMRVSFGVEIISKRKKVSKCVVVWYHYCIASRARASRILITPIPYPALRSPTATSMTIATEFPLRQRMKLNVNASIVITYHLDLFYFLILGGQWNGNEGK